MMTEPFPGSPLVPSAGHSGLLDHVRAWFSRDVAPELADLKATAVKVRELAPELKSLADAVVMLAKAVDPAAAPGIAAAVTLAEEAAEAVGRIAGDLAATGA
jgi:hypothetical protein